MGKVMQDYEREPVMNTVAKIEPKDVQTSNAITPMEMLQQAVQSGSDLTVIEKLMNLQERWEAVKMSNGWHWVTSQPLNKWVCYPYKRLEDSDAAYIVEACNAYPKLMEERERLREVLFRASRKLEAYVGVCNGDKELVNTVLPMAKAALASLETDNG